MVDRLKIALIFPGQGSQQPGMGKDFYDASPEARGIFDQADQILGRSITKLCFEGTEEELRRTSNTQPALYVTSAAMLAAARAAGIEGSMAAGHSLGEYTALYAAGGVDFATGLKLVDLRGRAMEQAGKNRPGPMAALLGLDPAKGEPVCAEASAAGVVVPANWNNSMQIVISGEEAGIDRAIELAKAAGAKKGTKLNVGGAFHSPLMAEAVQILQSALGGAVISRPKLRFVANVSAEFLDDPEAIRKSLGEQIVSCVRWEQTIQTFAGAGATHFIEVGPGTVLSGLLKRIDSSLKSININNVNSMSQASAALAS
ncbi:ACP S-malonyltransferase [Candidatus Sumerlaeota bacterium]|nr:ACP S-malonyltransferase [Candidatus Sumerlaeota bacterium]